MQRFCPVAEKILTCEGKTKIKIAYPSRLVDDALHYWSHSLLMYSTTRSTPYSVALLLVALVVVLS